MTLLPIAAPTTPPNGAAPGEPTSSSGDFAALLALIAGIVPLPPGEPASPDVDPSTGDAAEPTPSPILLEAAPAAAQAARPHPLAAEDVPPPAAQPPAAAPPQPPPAAAVPQLPPVEAQPAEPEGPAAIDRPRAEVAPPGRSPMPRTVPASPVAVEASRALTETTPALTETTPPPTPASDTPGPPEAEAVVMPLGSSHRPERPAVRVPAAPVALAASPALIPQPGPADLPLNPEHPVQEDPPEHRIPEKPVPEVTAPAPAPWPAAAIRAEAPIPADAPAATPVAPPAIPEQIVSAVVPLHGRGDGRHEVTLELRPEDLGTIRVEVSVEHQTVHLTLHAAEPATGRLLSAGLADLRSALADAGLQAGHVAVSPDGGTGTGRRSRPQTESEPSVPHKTTPTSAVPAPTRTVRPAAAGRLDLFL